MKLELHIIPGGAHKAIILRLFLISESPALLIV